MAPSGSARTSSIRLRMALPPPFVKFLMLGTASTLFGLADGCLRQSSSASSSSSSNHNHNRPSMSENTTPVANHRLPCDQNEVYQAACLNGGECFAVTGYRDQRHVSCQCPAEFTGERCQEFYIDPEIPNLLKIVEDNIRTAHVTAAVSVCVLVFFVVMLMIYVYIKYRRKSRIPLESMRGPRLEIAEYSCYNTKVRRLSSKKNGATAAAAECYADDAPVKELLHTQSAVSPTHAQTKLPQSNGKEDLDTSKTPLLDEETPKKNGDITRPQRTNQEVANPMPTGETNPNDSFSPDLDDIRFIDEATLPRPSKSKAKANNSDSESQL